jgi:uncharacterized membrane protein YgcG
MLRVTGLALLFLMPAGAALAVPSDVNDFTFDSFEAEYALSRDAARISHLEVVETIVARFPEVDQNRGIIRAIPNDYDGVDLATQITAVVDERGEPVHFELNDTGEFLEVILGTDEFVHGVTTYVVSYSQENVVRSFDDTGADEFYWDVNGTGWGQPFDRVSMTLRVEAPLLDALSGEAACYEGALGESNENCVLLHTGVGETVAVFSAEATELAPGETLTVAVGFAPGTFVTPEPTIDPEFPGEIFTPRPIPLWLQAASAVPGLLSVGALVMSIVARSRAGRDAPGRGTIVVQYSEPEDLDILQAAHFMHRSQSALPAALVRLAVRKNLRILAYAVDGGSEPYTLQYLGHANAGPLDERLLSVLFGPNPQPGATRGFGSYDQKLMSELGDLSAHAKDSLVELGYLARATGQRTGIALGLIQLGLVLVTTVILVGSLFAFFTLSGFVLASLALAIIGTVVSFVLGYRRLLVTEKGAAARDFLIGLRQYLQLAEQDRLRMLQSPAGAERVNVGDNLELIKLYERLLPWAVLWGVEDQWMHELAVRVQSVGQQPDWFVGSTGFDVSAFSTTMRAVSTTISPPSSSSSGGWSGSSGGSFSGGSFGGGSSGGGGGGGGGGGR